MINFEKHTIRFGTGDIRLDVIRTPEGKPILTFANNGEPDGPGNRMYMGFDTRERIDGLISVLRSVRDTYYPEADNTLGSTRAFRIYSDEADG